MVNEFKLRRPFCTPKPEADLWMRVDLPLDKKTVENQDWATGPSGRGAVAGRGPLGLRAFGPLGRLGPWAAGRWAAGLLLAKPKFPTQKNSGIENFKAKNIVRSSPSLEIWSTPLPLPPPQSKTEQLGGNFSVEIVFHFYVHTLLRKSVNFLDQWLYSGIEFMFL